MHLKSDKIEITINYEAEEVIKEVFQSLLSRYQIDMNKVIKKSKSWIIYR